MINFEQNSSFFIFFNHLNKNTNIKVAAMITSYMKELNPSKKIFFVCDRIPLVFQQGSYLRNQCGLRVGEFCSENKEFMQSQLNADVYVFTCDLLINLLLTKQILLENCCCLIIDEIHHAKSNHSFARLIQHYYDELENDFKPRLIGRMCYSIYYI
jgi:ERCC4-related helicase